LIVGLEVTGRYRYPPPDAAWLARRVEDVIEADLPIIDAHHHLWAEPSSHYLLDEFAADLAGGHRILATVAVQAHHGYRTTGAAHLAPVGETEKIAAMAEAAEARGFPSKIAAAIVAHADLTLSDRLDEVLDAHDLAAKGRLRGIRHSVSHDPNFPDGIVIRPAPEGLLANRQYRAGLARLAARGLRYDAMLYHAQLPELTAMAQAMPDLAIVLDHIGCILGIGPYRGYETETFDQWRSAMADLAACPNVTVKIGGFGMIIGGASWHDRDMPPAAAELAHAWRPYVETCIEVFGAARCMFESNFPVDKAMYSYRTLWNAFKLLTAGASRQERAALFSGTAAKVYSIPIPASVEIEHV
jgi:predicted TIM-barrel fold metal-dependent hydrolase